MELTDEGGAELVVDARKHNEGKRRADQLDVKIADADGLRVFFGRVFDIHRHLIAKSLGNDACKALGVGAVGVELDLIVADVAHAAKEILKIGLQKRLAAADGDSVKDALAFAKMREDLVDTVALGPAGIENERRIVAEGAAKVASAREDRAGSQPGVIEKCEFIESLNVHFVTYSKKENIVIEIIRFVLTLYLQCDIIYNTRRWHNGTIYS